MFLFKQIIIQSLENFPKSDGDRVQIGEPLIAFDEFLLLASDIRDAKISLSSANNTLSRLNSEIKVIQNKETIPPSDPLQLAIYNSLVKEIKNHKSLNSSTRLLSIELENKLGQVRSIFQRYEYQ